MPLKNDAITMFFHIFLGGEALLQSGRLLQKIGNHKIVGGMYIESGRISDSHIAWELDVITDSLDQLAEFWSPRLILLGIDNVITLHLLTVVHVCLLATVFPVKVSRPYIFDGATAHMNKFWAWN